MPGSRIEAPTEIEARHHRRDRPPTLSAPPELSPVLALGRTRRAGWPTPGIVRKKPTKTNLNPGCSDARGFLCAAGRARAAPAKAAKKAQSHRGTAFPTERPAREKGAFWSHDGRQTPWISAQAFSTKEKSSVGKLRWMPSPVFVLRGIMRRPRPCGKPIQAVGTDCIARPPPPLPH
jgi:hypothetical protein